MTDKPKPTDALFNELDGYIENLNKNSSFPKSWLLYSRVSTRDQTNENQRLRLIEWAERLGYNYEYFEETESTRKTRPIKAKVLSLLRSGDYEGVAVIKFDRWARSLSELSLEVTELQKKNINFVSLKENIDLSTSTGKLQFHIFGAFAEFERDRIRENTLDGLHRAKLQGKTLGRPAGSKDTKKRRKSGYILRHAKNRQKSDEDNGVNQEIDFYLNNTPLNNKIPKIEEKSNLNPPCISEGK